MIFVTVGTHHQSFNRLLQFIDELITSNKIKEEVIMQIGHSTYEPKNAKWFRFTDYKTIENLNKNARIIITHGGAGCILAALNFSKPVIAVPRLKEFAEHTDNHQLELVRTLSKEKKLIAIYDLKDLNEVIHKIKTRNIQKQTKSMLSEEIKKYLQNL